MPNKVEPNEIEWTDEDLEIAKATLENLAQLHEEEGRPRGKERAELFRDLAKSGLDTVVFGT